MRAQPLCMMYIFVQVHVHAITRVLPAQGRDVSSSELHKLLQERPGSLALVDTRTKPETDVSMIPGAPQLLANSCVPCRPHLW